MSLRNSAYILFEEQQQTIRTFDLLFSILFSTAQNCSGDKFGAGLAVNFSRSISRDPVLNGTVLVFAMDQMPLSSRYAVYLCWIKMSVSVMIEIFPLCLFLL